MCVCVCVYNIYNINSHFSIKISPTKLDDNQMENGRLRSYRIETTIHM